MAKKPSKPRVRQVPRETRKDARGIPLTSDNRPFTILPSDFSTAMQQPPGTPVKTRVKLDPAMPTTAIPELNIIKLTPFAYYTVIQAIRAADKIQQRRLNPKGGPNLRYRVEIAAAFLAEVLRHAYTAGVDTKSNPEELANLCLNLVIRRGQEIYGQDGA